MTTALVMLGLAVSLASLAGHAAPRLELSSAQGQLQKKNCAALLHRLTTSPFSDAQKREFSEQILALRRQGDQTLETEPARAVFNYAVDRFESLIAGTPTSLVRIDVSRDLKRIQEWLRTLLHKPKTKPREHELAFGRATLQRIDQALNHPTRGVLGADEWTLLAIDSVRALTPLLEDQDKVDQPPKRLQSYVGDRIENILIPAWITTDSLSIRDFNAASVVPAILGGVVSKIIHIDGQKEGDNPTDFLIDHDLLFHGTDLRRKRLTLMIRELELFGYRYHPELQTLTPINTSSSVPSSLLSGARHWIAQMQRNLNRLQLIQSRVVHLPARTQDAVAVLRFFAEHEQGEFLLFYDSHGSGTFQSFLHSPIEATTGVYQTSSPERDLLIRLKRKNDIGEEYPLLAALSTTEISKHLKRAAEFLDSFLTKE